ncbi:serine/threonine protein kinase [Catenulispora sp. GAS73]|uniref:serine/threonine-protein kinase n=1 Tax=Catenulispora sp. GAS73 TaxID=3156269 RepID=UPI00351410AC
MAEADAANVWAFGPQASLAAGFLNPPEPEPLRPRDPERVGGYTLVGRLGAGGMGVAYLARDDAGREVALKRVHEGLAEHEEFRARFIREVAAARRVPGRHTARVVDADVLADPPWLATEYFRCWTLAQQVPRFGPLTVENAGTLIARLADALAAMHAAGLVHRDLKPSNILLAPDGPRIIDFGIARSADLAALTTTGRMHGTPGYMAPEQIEGRETGPPVDVFALGACLVYATTGTSPFWDGSPTTLMYRTVHAEPDLGSMPEELREVTLRCLTKEAEGRPTAAELAAEFAEYGGQAQMPVLESDGVPAEDQPEKQAKERPAAEAIDIAEADRSKDEADVEPEVPVEHNVIDGTTAFIPETSATESRQNIDFPPPDRRPRTGLVIATAAGGLVAAAAVALALATNSGSTAAPPARAGTSQPSIAVRSHPSTSAPSTNPSRSASAIPGQPPPLPRTLVGYSGRLLGANLAWFESLRIPASSAPWSAGGPWSAIAGPGCPDGVGHALSASTGWSPDPTHGGAVFGGCGGADLVAPTVAPGQTATARVAWSFTPGPAVSECALFAYNANSPANLAFGDYSTAGRAGQFPMSGASHAGEWVELGIAAPDADGNLTVGVSNDQPADVQHPPGPTVTAAQVVAVCGGPSV